MTCLCADGWAQDGAFPSTSDSISPRSEESSQTACSLPLGGKVSPWRKGPAESADIHGFLAMDLFKDSCQAAPISEPPASYDLQQHLRLLEGLSSDGSNFPDASKGGLINLGTAAHSEVVFLAPF